MKIFSLKKGDKVVEGIVKTLEKENIKAGSILALGALSEAEIMIYNLGKKEYLSKKLNGVLEVGSFLAIISKSPENKIMIHPHITISDDKFKVYTGHLKEGIVAATLEIAIFESKQNLKRYSDSNIGLNLLK